VTNGLPSNSMKGSKLLTL